MHASLLAVVALAAVTTPGKPAHRPYALLTLASGHTFRVLKSGPMMDETKKRVGIAYVTVAQNEHELQADSDELFEYLLPRAEEQNGSEVAVITWLKTGSGVVEHEIVFQRQKGGKWKKSGAPVPFVPPPPQPDERDRASERRATDAATAWLALLDEGKLGDTWDTAAPLLRDRTPRQQWVESGESMRTALGKNLLRKPFAVLDTDTLGSAPTGHYMVLEYRTKFAQRPDAFESVTAMLGDDGKWRVAGYSVR